MRAESGRGSRSERLGAFLAAIPLIRRARQRLFRLRGALGRRLSVRAKLTIWYGLMAGLTLAIAGTAMYRYVEYQLSNEVDTNLRNAVQAVNARLARGAAGIPTQADIDSAQRVCTQERAFGPGLQYCRRVQYVLDEQTAALDHPGQFEQVILNLPHVPQLGPFIVTPYARPGVTPGAREEPRLYILAIGGYVQYTTLRSGTSDFRVYLAPLYVPPSLRGQIGFGGVLEVFQNERAYQSVEHTVLVTLLLGIPIGLLVALLVGWWIARAALRPLNRISRTVKAIGDSKDMSRRLHFTGPDDEVGRLADTFDGMMERLERVFETQRRFIADASHELRTPLTAIRGNADLMRFAPTEDKDICLAAIRREAERMTRLVSDLLLLAEADVADQELQLADVDLQQLVFDVHRSAQILGGDNVSVVLEQTAPLHVRGDADRLKQLLLNLSDNAIKFTPPGGAVAIDLRRQANQVRIAISDSGIGIAPEEQAAIFQRFYRIEQSRSTRGSGLGLAISSWIVQAHGGTLEVNSQPGKGSTFTVSLPLDSSAAGDGSQTDSSSPLVAGV